MVVTEYLIYGGGGATVASLVAWILRLRLRLSQESVELRANRAKISQIDRLEDELDKAIKRAEIAEAKAQVAESLRVEIRHLWYNYTRMRLRAAGQDTGLADFPEDHDDEP